LKAAGTEPSWEQVVSGFAEPIRESKVTPDRKAAELYREFLELYRACENHALRDGPDPTPVQERFRRRAAELLDQPT
jgi:hypothetical protein